MNYHKNNASNSITINKTINNLLNYSIQSTESGGTDHSPRGSTRRKNRNPYSNKHKNGEYDSNVGTSIGMLHIGVVFLVFGVFLLGAGLIPDDGK